ncbi:MAG TPA: DNA-binding response regulator, partial [Candidatus Latescibacteria bacterium]|nr:DNA-binding response regulator [Candidatus Latescibacterota bacterium]
MISAQDGNQGLEQVKTHLSDLIISEILMPNM